MKKQTSIDVIDICNSCAIKMHIEKLVPDLKGWFWIVLHMPMATIVPNYSYLFIIPATAAFIL